ncbi:ADP-glyceromanno-heptose 6-epimerase [Planktomarina temperata]|nr:ADP-glyceromanno-heptose 6-epimerase [Planktomarina temperata]
MAKYVITGAAGFIGSNLAIKLDQMQHNLVLVDNFENGRVSEKLFSVRATEMIKLESLNTWLEGQTDIDGVFHLGACSNTQEWDGNHLITNNFQYTRDLFETCSKKNIRFVYASSASVYGLGKNGFCEVQECENPINFYAYSKLLFDNYFRSLPIDRQLNTVGLRYFNVYGKHEDHKGNMASPVHKFTEQALDKGTIKIFSDTFDVKKEFHLRDFIHVDDCVDLNIFFMNSENVSGIYNCGTGISNSFLDVALQIQRHLAVCNIKVEIQEVPMPDHLMNSYQFYTNANLERLNATGWDKGFRDLLTSVKEFVDYKMSL